MESVQSRSPMSPLLIAAAIAVIVFCATGVAAIMGWIPTTGAGSSASEPQAQAPLQQEDKSAKQASTGQVKAPVQPAKAQAQPKAQPQSVAQVQTKVQPQPVAQAEPRVEEPPRPTQMAAAKPTCRDCGVIEAVREIEKAGEGSGLGAVAGGVVGGVAGRQVGGGRGRDLATIAGAVGGAVVGHQIEKHVKKATVFQITIRFEDGTFRTLTQAEAPSWRAGDRVKIVDGQIQAI
jgi:outer membrane lipoprotein SlyB